MNIRGEGHVRSLRALDDRPELRQRREDALAAVRPYDAAPAALRKRRRLTVRCPRCSRRVADVYDVDTGPLVYVATLSLTREPHERPIRVWFVDRLTPPTSLWSLPDQLPASCHCDADRSLAVAWVTEMALTDRRRVAAPR